jgi:hypothetical protein
MRNISGFRCCLRHLLFSLHSKRKFIDSQLIIQANMTCQGTFKIVCKCYYVFLLILRKLADSERNNNGKEYRYVNNNLYTRCDIVVLYSNNILKDPEEKAQ